VDRDLVLEAPAGGANVAAGDPALAEFVRSTIR